MTDGRIQIRTRKLSND